MILKKITKLKIIRHLLGYLIYRYLKVVYSTTKWQIINENFNLASTGAIYAFWHGKLAMMPYVFPSNRIMNILISTHTDGDIIKIAMHHFGLQTINGSSKRNPTMALRMIIKKAKNNENIAITPDGSRGPAYQINGNIIEIAKLVKLPIIPVSYAVNKKKILNSWDKFMIPLLFNRGVLIYGEPIIVNQNDDANQIANLKNLLAVTLSNITKQADLIASN